MRSRPARDSRAQLYTRSPLLVILSLRSLPSQDPAIARNGPPTSFWCFPLTVIESDEKSAMPRRRAGDEFSTLLPASLLTVHPMEGGGGLGWVEE
ncbi:hypothetical protein C2S51_011391 [Perilla frutescens var. frutescens]|nr:hypothetical protein C2S51_011391 [Perilla frutescens var. frutescens]